MPGLVYPFGKLLGAAMDFASEQIGSQINDAFEGATAAEVVTFTTVLTLATAGFVYQWNKQSNECQNKQASGWKPGLFSSTPPKDNTSQEHTHGMTPSS